MTPENESKRRVVGGYRDKYRKQLVSFMARGYSLTAFAGSIDVSRATLMRWCERSPKFAEAVECGQAARARALEEGLFGSKGKGPAAVRIQALKTAAPDEWPAKGARSAPRRRGKAADAAFDLPDNGRT